MKPAQWITMIGIFLVAAAMPAGVASADPTGAANVHRFYWASLRPLHHQLSEPFLSPIRLPLLLSTMIPIPPAPERRQRLPSSSSLTWKGCS